MKLTRRRRRPTAMVYALYVNAALLLAILAAVLSRGNGLGVGSAAFGAPQMQPIAGGGGYFLMPAQFSQYTWGCYVMDIDSQNLCAYQYLPGASELRFVASRNFREDTKLREWNTKPGLADIARLNQLAKAGIRGAQPPSNEPGDSQGGPPIVPPDPPRDNMDHKGTPGPGDGGNPATGQGDPAGSGGATFGPSRPSDLAAPPDTRPDTRPDINDGKPDAKGPIR